MQLVQLPSMLFVKTDKYCLKMLRQLRWNEPNTFKSTGDADDGDGTAMQRLKQTLTIVWIESHDTTLTTSFL